MQDSHELQLIQLRLLFKLKLSKGYSLLDWEFEILTPEQKTKAIDVLIKNNHTFTPKEFEHASSTQKETYFERKLTIFKKLIDTLLIDGTPKDSIKSITDQYDIKGYELKFLSPVQKKRYMEIISKFN
jgi:hypothetical protein